MRVFYVTDFTGHWPVGTAAVVVAENVEQAKWQLEAQLAVENLPQSIAPGTIRELDTTEAHAVVLLNGDY